MSISTPSYTAVRAFSTFHRHVVAVQRFATGWRHFDTYSAPFYRRLEVLVPLIYGTLLHREAGAAAVIRRRRRWRRRRGRPRKKHKPSMSLSRCKSDCRKNHFYWNSMRRLSVVSAQLGRNNKRTSPLTLQ